MTTHEGSVFVMHDPARILIVDDNETNRDILKTRLAVHGYDLLEAGDGEEALAIAQEHHPDLVLLDVMMPKVDGIEVCRRLKHDPGFAFMSVILVTREGGQQGCRDRGSKRAPTNI